jgi:hypothetical protein
LPKDGSSTDGSGGNCQTGPRSEASANNDKAKPEVEKCPEVVATEQNMVPEEKAETKIEAGTSSL